MTWTLLIFYWAMLYTAWTVLSESMILDRK